MSRVGGRTTARQSAGRACRLRLRQSTPAGQRNGDRQMAHGESRSGVRRALGVGATLMVLGIGLALSGGASAGGKASSKVTIQGGGSISGYVKSSNENRCANGREVKVYRVKNGDKDLVDDRHREPERRQVSVERRQSRQRQVLRQGQGNQQVRGRQVPDRSELAPPTKDIAFGHNSRDRQATPEENRGKV